MSRNERDERGRFRPDHADREFLATVADREPAGTAEIAEAVGVTRQNADQRLRQLADDGTVTSKKIGGTLIWSVTAEGLDVEHVDPDDGFWEAETYAVEEMSATDIDDVLYG